MSKTCSLLAMLLVLAGFTRCATTPKKQTYLGTAVSVSYLQKDPKYKEMVDTLFTVITPENEMKWGVTEKQQGKEDTKDMDTLYEYVTKTNKKLRGHTILAHTQNPDWVQGLSKDAMQAAAYKHMELIFKKYSKNMISLDVCNEILDDGTGALRQSVWLQTWGDQFVEDIYTKARELGKMYNPDVLLFINDYSIEDKNAKSDKMFEIATALKKKGVLDGVGFQSHLEVGKFPKGFKENMQRFTEAGLKVAISELDVRIKLQGRSESEIAQDRQQQTKDFEAAFQVCAEIPECVGITLWGVSDQYSWIPTNPGSKDAGEALLFNKDYMPKPAVTSLNSFFPSSSATKRVASRCVRA